MVDIDFDDDVRGRIRGQIYLRLPDDSLCVLHIEAGVGLGALTRGRAPLRRRTPAFDNLALQRREFVNQAEDQFLVQFMPG